MEQSTAAEQRAFAVAKLKRAASLSRMKDGWRPPMHVEALSKGEKSQAEEKADGPQAPAGDQPFEGPETARPPGRVLELPPTNVQPCHPNEPAVDEPVEESVTTTTPDSVTAKKKKRRRSRSRSRGSKDLKNKLKVVIPSLPTVQSNNKSSQDEDAAPTRLPPRIASPKPFKFDPTDIRFTRGASSWL